MGSSTALYVSKRTIRTKWLSFEPFNFKCFSRHWAENIQQSYWNFILRVHMNLWKMRFNFEVVWFLKVFWQLEEDISGLGWNISTWLEILHSTRSEKEFNWNSSKHFLFLNGYRALIENFSNFWQNFPRGCHWCNVRVQGKASS